VVVPLSLITSPYGWVFDQMLLLPTVAFFAARGALWQLYGGIVLNLVMMSMPARFGQQAFIWYTAAFLLLSLTVHRQRSS
jgi:hypothetical protein